ncbi:MAG: GAF domain-containing protein, partial [Fibrobacterota bacterium]
MKISDSFLREIIRLSEELNLIHDLDAVLDKVLSEARRFTVSDAGSIFLKEGKALKFRYVQNDTLFKGNDKNKFIYSNSEVPINHSSITGFVASTGKELIIDDAYSLSDNLPYSFNRSFDKSSNYRTQSILAVPLKLGGGRVVGVLQLINAKNE